MGPLSKKLDMKTLQGPKAKKYDSKTLNMGASKMDMKMMIDKGMVDGSLDSSGILGKKFADKKGKKSDKSKKGKEMMGGGFFFDQRESCGALGYLFWCFLPEQK